MAVRAGDGNQRSLAEKTVTQWLGELGQSEVVQKRFWNPMAVATLNESPDRASADMFARVIHEAFLQSRKDSELVISKVGLSDLYVTGATKFIEQCGGEIRSGCEVDGIEFDSHGAAAIRLRNSERIEATTVIAAVPPQQLTSLIPSEVSSRWTIFGDLARFSNSPIVSINLWYEKPVTDFEFVGLLDSRVDWVFNKNVINERAGPRQHLALVISGAHSVSKLTKEQLTQLAQEEMNRFFPLAQRTALLHSFVVREHDATISHTIGVTRMRPTQQTPIHNFFLAGDWTNTGLPATIEGAVRSGNECARLIVEA